MLTFEFLNFQHFIIYWEYLLRNRKKGLFVLSYFNKYNTVQIIIFNLPLKFDLKSVFVLVVLR